MISLGGCFNPVITHPTLTYNPPPQLPKFTRAMLDCGKHNPSTLALCKRIVEREAYLSDHIETLGILIDTHNSELLN